MWQKCPLCNGTGKDYLKEFNPCPVCDGYRIINSITGLPPKKDTNKSDNNFTVLKSDITELKNPQNPK